MRHGFGRTARNGLPALLICVVCWTGGGRAEDLAHAAHDQVAARPLVWNAPVARLSPLREASEAADNLQQAALLFGQGRWLYQRGKLPESLQSYQRAFQFDPSPAIVREILPLALQLGRFEEAVRYGAIAPLAELHDPLVVQRLAVLLTDEHRYAEAIDFYARSLELTADPDPGNADARTVARFEMGRLQFIAGQFEQSAKSFDEVLQAIENPAALGVSSGIVTALMSEPAATLTLIAEAYLAAGRLPEAEAVYRRAATQPEPPNRALAEMLPFQLARIAHKSADMAATTRYLQDYFEQQGSIAGGDPYEMFVETVSQSPQQDVESRLQELLARDPQNPALRLFMADWYRRQRQWTRAIPLYESLRRDAPAIAVYGSLVESYRMSEAYDKLLDTLAEATGIMQSLDPFAAEAAACAGDSKTLAKLQELAQARMAAGNETPRDALGALGLLGIAARDFALSDQFFPAAVAARKAAPPDGGPVEATDAELFLNWGLGLFLADEYRRAATVFRVSLEQQQVSPELLAVFEYYLAAALELSGDTDGALRVARQAAEHAPRMPSFQLRPAWVLFHAKRWQEADAAYRAWIATYERNFEIPGVRDAVREARLVLSTICTQTARDDEAIEWLTGVLDEFPRDAAASNDLGYLLAEQGRAFGRAERLIRVAVEAEPDNHAYRDSLGWILFRRGRFEEAVHELQKAAADEAPDPLILSHLGDALAKTGEPAEAIATWQRALERLLHAPDESLQEALKAKLHEATRTATESD